MCDDPEANTGRAAGDDVDLGCMSDTTTITVERTYLAAKIWDLRVRVEGVAEDGVLDGFHDGCYAVYRWNVWWRRCLIQRCVCMVMERNIAFDVSSCMRTYTYTHRLETRPASCRHDEMRVWRQLRGLVLQRQSASA